MYVSSSKDGFEVMKNISDHLQLAPALRPPAFGDAAQEFLQEADPSKTPFWVLFGYDVEAKRWHHTYNLKNSPELQQLQKSAREFTRIARMADWTSWPELYRWILDSIRKGNICIECFEL